jgi:hypothetical protein
MWDACQWPALVVVITPNVWELRLRNFKSDTSKNCCV